MDTITPEQRSEVMSRVGGKNTRPELTVRRLLHALGFRFRIHRKDLPGNPDIVLPKWRTAIFVHGCFWHGHTCRRGAKPTSNTDFWSEKIRKTQARDRNAQKRLRADGWRVIVLWECDLADLDHLRTKLKGIATTDE